MTPMMDGPCVSCFNVEKMRGAYWHRECGWLCSSCCKHLWRDMCDDAMGDLAKGRVWGTPWDVQCTAWSGLCGSFPSFVNRVVKIGMDDL